MTISDSQSTFGAWSLRLRTKASRDENNKLLPATPQNLLDLFAVSDSPDAFLGHVIVTPQAFTDKDEVDVLSQSRYTGVLRQSSFSNESVEISGSGLVYWLGDLQERGPIFSTELNLVSESFTDGITAILPPAITAGTIVPEVGTQSASYLFVTARAALENWLDMFGAEYYITPQGELNAGTPASLFPTYNAPTTFVIRKGSGDDPNLKPLPLGSAVFSGDMVHYATKVISLTQTEDESFVSAEVSASTSKRDLHGNLVDITDINNEVAVLAANVAARAAARLAQIGVPRTALELSTENYDIHGDFKPGDSIWVYDVASGLYDLSNEIEFMGQIYWPIKLRVLEITYPVVKGMGVYFRAPDLNGTIYDLTPYVDYEPAGTSQIEVGAFSRSLIPPSSGGIGGVIAPVLNPDTDPPPVANAPTAVGNVLNVQVIWDVGTGGVPYSMPLDIAGAQVHISTTSGFTPDPTSFIGYLTATKANVEGNADAIKTFEVATDVQRYVRLVPYDLAGNLGPASPEVAVTVGLIDTANITNLAVTDAKIGSMSVAKLTAGDISAAIITITASGMFRFGRTTTPFHWGKIDANGIHTFINGSAAYTGGTSQLDLDIAAGTLAMIGGQISSALTGKRVVMGPVGFETHSFQAYGAEGNPAIYFGVVVGSGGTRYVQTTLQGAHPDVPSTRTAGLMLESTSWDLSRDTLARLAGEQVLLLQQPGTSFVQVADNIGITGDNISLNADDSYLSMTAPAIDLAHDLGGRLFIDDFLEFISGGATRAWIDDIPGGSTGDSALRVDFSGIGTRRIIADPVTGALSIVP